MHCSVFLCALALLLPLAVRAAPAAFVVVHSDPAANRALTELIRGASSDTVWVYAEMQRWRPEHAEAMWRFDSCGRTEGRWPMCGSGVLQNFRDPFDARSASDVRRRAKLAAEKKHRHHRRERVEDLSPGPTPLFAGFGMDLNVANHHRSAVMQALLKHEAIVIVLKSAASATRAVLRAAIYGAVNPHTKGTPGREAGVARSLFGHEHPALLYHDEPLLCRDGKPDTVVRLLRKHQEEQGRLAGLAAAFRAQGLAVHEVDVESGLVTKLATLGGDPALPAANSTVPMSHDIPMDVVDRSCVDLLNRARLRLAIWESDDSPGLIADIDRVLADVERWRASKGEKPK